MAEKLAKVRNLTVWQLPPDQVQQLGKLADKAMTLQVTVQDGVITIDGGGKSVELAPVRLFGEG